MAPEQAMGLMPLDNRVDIYSLAAVTYAMLTSRPPFLVCSIADIVARDPLLAPEPIASRLGAPSTLDGLLLSGLATDRNRRPPTALLLAQGLEAIGTEMQPGGTSRQSSEGSVITHAPPRRERRGPLDLSHPVLIPHLWVPRHTSPHRSRSLAVISIRPARRRAS
jgi:eukaryotic-like serine/threonine-protein kinase